MAEDALLSGDGSDADFLFEYGDNYVYNQTAFDKADNGTAITSAAGSTYTSPSWMQSLGNLFGSAASVASTVMPVITGSTTTANKTVATPSAGATSTKTTSSTTVSKLKSLLPWILAGLAVVVGLVLFIRRK